VAGFIYNIYGTAIEAFSKYVLTPAGYKWANAGKGGGGQERVIEELAYRPISGRQSIVLSASVTENLA
jgi:hypothetical protein